MYEDYIKIKSFARKIRSLCIEMVYQQKGSHIGGALSVADIIAVLYSGYMNQSASDPNNPDRDRLFYSKGHACTVIYAALALKKYFDFSLIDSFTKNGSYMTSHVNSEISGVEFSAGSLGHVLPVASGVAFAANIKKHTFKTFCVVSDGELNEGSNWEAILFCGHHKLSNLTLVVDYNKIQSFGFTKDILDLDPLSDKFKAFNWHVLEIDGHSIEEICTAFGNQQKPDKPTVVIAHTIKGKGVSFMENKLEWHYKSPNSSEYELALRELAD